MRLANQFSIWQLLSFGAIVGVISGVGAIVFRGLIGLTHNLLFYGELNWHYAANSHATPVAIAAYIILIPVIGALFVTYLTKNFAPEARGHGVPEAIYAIFYQDGKIRPAVAVIKALASAISIGSGGSVGREGPIIQIGAAFGSSLGQWLNLSAQHCRVLIAAGAGAGIAATFNAPIGGIAFAIELMLVSVTAINIGIVAIATIVATTLSYAYFGNTPALGYVVTNYTKTNIDFDILLLVIIPFGILIGLIATAFIKGLYLAEDLFNKINNPYFRHVTGMALVGLILYGLMHYFGHYYVEGVGYATIEDIIKFLINNPWLLLLLFISKYFATCLTLGSGASGGVFSPALFMGATVGACCGILLNSAFPALGINPTMLAIAGMAGVVGSATGAILTAISMTFEMTRDYNDILPIIITVSLAYVVRYYYSPESIYTLKLFRRGFRLPKGMQANILNSFTAKDIANKQFSIIQSAAKDTSKTLTNIQYLLIMKDNHLSGIIDFSLDILPESNYNQHTAQIISIDTPWQEILQTYNAKTAAYLVVSTTTTLNTLQEWQNIYGIIGANEIIKITQQYNNL